MSSSSSELSNKIVKFVAEICERYTELCLDEVLSMLKYGETRVALEELCVAVEDFEIAYKSIEIAYKTEIVRLCRSGAVDESYWQGLVRQSRELPDA